MTTFSIYFRVCIWLLGFTNWRLLEHAWAPLSFALQIMAKLLCYCLVCLIQLMCYMLSMKRCSVTSDWKVKVGFICNKVLCNS